MQRTPQEGSPANGERETWLYLVILLGFLSHRCIAYLKNVNIISTEATNAVPDGDRQMAA
jgi:hypothetical protein